MKENILKKEWSKRDVKRARNLLTGKTNERTIKALHSAVCYTLDKWCGEGELDQEQLIVLKSMLQGCRFEVEVYREE